jgi:hypothetical protein
MRRRVRHGRMETASKIGVGRVWRPVRTKAKKRTSADGSPEPSDRVQYQISCIAECALAHERCSKIEVRRKT